MNYLKDFSDAPGSGAPDPPQGPTALSSEMGLPEHVSVVPAPLQPPPQGAQSQNRRLATFL